MRAKWTQGQVRRTVYSNLFQRFLTLYGPLCLIRSLEDKGEGEALNRMDTILSGTVTLGLHVDFLSHNNHADLLLLKNTKVGGLGLGIAGSLSVRTRP